MLEERRQRIGAQIKRARHLHGWTQEELAHQASVTAKTIQRVEAKNPKHDLRAGTIRKIAAALELDPKPLLREIYGYEEDATALNGDGPGLTADEVDRQLRGEDRGSNDQDEPRGRDEPS